MSAFKFIKHSFVSIVILSIFSGLNAQELSNVGKSPLMTVSGGLSVNQVLFWSHGGSSSSREPYAYTLTGNLNLAIYGWSIPLSVIYSNKQWSHSQPFNQYTLAPSYKWIKLYLGNASMSFSPYTLSGHQFWGFGAELTPPGKISGSLMVGRLQKKTMPDSASSVDAAYQRYGAGGKINYQLPFGSLTAIVFYAKDDSSSLPGIADTTIYPQENLCLGLSGNMNVMKSFNFAFDYALSTLTSNLYAPAMSDYSLEPFYKRRESTHQYQALKTSFNYASPLGSIGAAYERVGAGYATLGAYYNSNDFQNYTLTYAGGLFQNKVTLSASYGIQKDNLSGNADQGTTRIVENLNVGFNPFEKLNMSVYYSNYNTYTHVKSVFDDINTTSPYANLDTLSYTQISESFGGNLSLALGSKEKATHRISFSGVFQKASQEQEGDTDYAGTNLFSSSLGYSLGLANIGLTPSLTVNYNRNVSDTLVTEVIGPSFNIRKSLFEKKLNTGLMVSYNQNLQNGIRQSENTIIRITASYVFLMKHNFSFSSATALRNSKSSGSSSENTLTLTYSYRFGGKNSKKNNEKEK
jgi:hypothetical protein